MLLFLDDFGLRRPVQKKNAGVFTGHDPSRGSAQGKKKSKISRGGSGWIGSSQQSLEMSRVGSGLVRILSNFTGRMKIS